MRRRGRLGKEWDRQVTCARCGKLKNEKGPVVEYRDQYGFHDMHAVCYRNFLDEKKQE